MTPREQDFEERLKALEHALGDLRRRELKEIKDEWHGVHYKWWVATLLGLLVLFMLSYTFYTKLGWVADQRSLPVGDDWLLRRLPVVNTLPVLSWGWFALHIYACGAAALYYPRRVPFLLSVLTVYMVVRTLFVFLSPIGAPAGMVDMRLHDVIFSRILGTWTFTNEFVFSGHTAIPFLFALFFETRPLKTLMLAGSGVMGVCVLLSRNHYTVDVLAAYLTGYAIFHMTHHGYERWIRPLSESARD